MGLKSEENTKWIIIDTKTLLALYGANRKTLSFTTKVVALEVAVQFFDKTDNFILISVNF